MVPVGAKGFAEEVDTTVELLVEGLLCAAPNVNGCATVAELEACGALAVTPPNKNGVADDPTKGDEDDDTKPNAEDVEATELLKRLDEADVVDAPNWKGEVEDAMRLDDPDVLLVKRPDVEEDDDPKTKELELGAEIEFGGRPEDVTDT